jgi:hypothetical protein
MNANERKSRELSKPQQSQLHDFPIND